MTNIPPEHFRRVRSFVRRDSRLTAAQERAQEQLAPQYGLSLASGLIDYVQVFQRSAPVHLEIGFGMGASLLAAASAFPDHDFIGVETHRPGIGALYLGIKANGLTNLRIYYADVMDVLMQSIPDHSLAGVQIFFPDPWQKRRHHPRRLIQPALIELVRQKLTVAGSLDLATDWEDYAHHMMQVLSAATGFKNIAGLGQFAERSIYRPILSKFEQRALRDGRSIFELQFQKL